MTALPLVGDARWRSTPLSGARWLEHVATWRPQDPDHLVTGEHETAVLLLGGTFDLVGGGTAWPARGARKDPFGGRPMAVFLPPRTDFRVGRGQGEILLIAARQPEVRVEATGRDVLTQKPLLPLAGSGKSFDPNSGEWRPAETFPTAPESLPPRRFERIVVGACTLERVFAPDYKAATLSVDEVVVPAGQTLRLDTIPGRPAAAETLVFVRAPAGAVLTLDGVPRDVQGDAAARALGAGDGAQVAATAGPVYVVLAYAGKGAAG